MKHNYTPKQVEEMSFDRLTLVMGQKGGKRFAPVNPAAEIVACKGSEVGTLERVLGAVKGVFGAESKADKAADDDIEDLLEQTTRSALYNAVWTLSDGISSIINAPGFDDAARKVAIDAFIEAAVLQITEISGTLFTEKAMEFAQAQKAGKRHSKADAAAIADAHKHVTKAHAALGKAKDALDTLTPSDSTDPTESADESGAGSAKATPLAEEGAIVPLTDSEKAEIVQLATESAVKAIEAKQTEASKALQASAAELKPLNLDEIATKAATAAVAALKPELDAAKAQAEKATADAQTAKDEAEKAKAEAEKAKGELADAVTGARSRQNAGAHADALERETQNANKSTEERLADAKPKTVLDAVRVICNH
jgi:hypothetical protein